MSVVRGRSRRRTGGGNPLLGGKQASVALGLAVFLTLATMTLGALGLSVGSGNNNYEVRLHFTTGNGIIEGSDVFFGGVKVGTVKTLELDKDAKAITMTVSIGRQYAPIHQDATAAIRPKSLLGEKYVAMTVGDPAKPAYNDGDTLPDSATSVNVELDQIINIFDEPTRKQLQVLINNLGIGVAGQGRNTNETFQAGTQDLNGLAKVTDTLQARDAELKRIIDALTKLTATLSSDQQRQTYINLLQHSEQVLTTLKAEDANVAQGIDRMNKLFGTYDAGLNGRATDLQGVFNALPNTVTDLDNLSINLARDGHIGYPTLANSIPGIVSGPLIFGDQSNSTQWTGNIWTRVMPAVGCFYVNHRAQDSTGAYSDNGGPIPTARGGGTGGTSGKGPYTFDSLPGLGPVCDAGSPTGLLGLLATACAGAPTNPVTQAICMATGHAVTNSAPAGAAQPAPGATGSATPGSGAATAPAPALPPGADQAQKDLLRYLLQ
ncbi:MAG: phospholipid/cholesterol/gamma-HCH transport system substrate-binding protein [Chloroflexota bacterium]|jgi:virulence factor Mce-like protein|nr:phospholipid/cholesterol/gamma-HCH transport system substrate-binding protein [Chloroflexota bacterium]